MNKAIDCEVNDAKSLASFIEGFLFNLQDYNKPLMIWNVEFQAFLEYCRSIEGITSLVVPYMGHDKAIVDNKLISISKLFKSPDKYIYPSTYKKGKTKGFYYIPATAAQIRESTNYICRTVQEAKLPVVCGMEATPDTDNIDFDKASFYNVHYKGSIPFIFVDGQIINSFDEWINWGEQSRNNNARQNIHPDIIRYLKTCPNDFNQSPQKIKGLPWIAAPFADPRNWMAFSAQLYMHTREDTPEKKYSELQSIPRDELLLYCAGILGKELAERFANFVYPNN